MNAPQKRRNPAGGPGFDDTKDNAHKYTKSHRAAQSTLSADARDLIYRARRMPVWAQREILAFLQLWASGRVSVDDLARIAASESPSAAMRAMLVAARCAQ